MEMVIGLGQSGEETDSRTEEMPKEQMVIVYRAAWYRVGIGQGSFGWYQEKREAASAKVTSGRLWYQCHALCVV